MPAVAVAVIFREARMGSMKVDSKAEISGIPALALRPALRKNQYCDHTTRGFATLLNAGQRKVASLLQRLQSDGFIRKHETYDAWENTIQGNALANASAAPLISRATATKTLTDWTARASAINADPEYAYVVSRITVFGSYLSDAPRLSDVDVSIQLRRRHSDPDMQAAVEAQAKRRNPKFYSLLEDIGRPEREVWKLLKKRSRSLQIAGGIPDGARRRVVFQEPT